MSVGNTPIDYSKCYRDLGVAFGAALIVCAAWRALGAILIGMLFAATILVAIGQAGARRERDKEIAERADRQHDAVLNGDAYGVYGEYPPVAPPEPRAAPAVRRMRYSKDWEWATIHGKRVMVIHRKAS